MDHTKFNAMIKDKCGETVKADSAAEDKVEPKKTKKDDSKK